MTVPLSTYRVQVNERFTLDDAAALVPYLQQLGIDWIYVSPILQAEAGSDHGYDVTDPSMIDASRGGEADLAALSAAARSAGMGIVVDIVPNHMGSATPKSNGWWWDLLTYGTASRFAEAVEVE
jgi:(1->4)-alpha-D-glucan 1-alpha-D-glucosylmutase